MAYTIYKTDGTVLLTLGEGKTDQKNTSLTLIGKNVQSYGEYFNNNLVGLLENFASVDEPVSPLVGQLWYDLNTGRLKVYDENSIFRSVSNLLIADTEPAELAEGDFWYDFTNKQLYVCSNGGVLNLVGPFDKSEYGLTGWRTEVMSDGTYDHTVLSLYNDNERLAILSGDSQFTLETSTSSFTTIYPGLNLNPTGGLRFIGTATSAESINGLDSTKFLRNDINQTTQGAFVVKNNLGLTVANTNNENIGIYVNTGTHEGTIAYNSLDKNFRLQIASSGTGLTSALYINSTNRHMGLWNTSPQYPLDVVGDTRIQGNLYVVGTTTNLSIVNLQTYDKNIELGYGQGTPSDSYANGGGITLYGENTHSITWKDNGSGWNFNDPVNLYYDSKTYSGVSLFASTGTGATFTVTNADGVYIVTMSSAGSGYTESFHETWSTSTPFITWTTATPWVDYWTTSGPFLFSWTTSTPYLYWSTSTNWIETWNTTTEATVYSGVSLDYNATTGTGLTVNVTKRSNLKYYAEISNAGINYLTSDVVGISGTKLGGTSPANDLYFSIQYANTTGNVISVSTFTGHGVWNTNTQWIQLTTATRHVEWTTSTPWQVWSTSTAWQGVWTTGSFIYEELTPSTVTHVDPLAESAAPTFNVTINTDLTYSVEISYAGTNWCAGDAITIYGTQFVNGVTPANDLTFSVTTTGTGGAVTGIGSIAGTATWTTSTPFYVTQTTGTHVFSWTTATPFVEWTTSTPYLFSWNTSTNSRTYYGVSPSAYEQNGPTTGTGLLLDITVNSDLTYSYSISDGGLLYTTGDQVDFYGTELGGTSPANDFILVVTETGGVVDGQVIDGGTGAWSTSSTALIDTWSTTTPYVHAWSTSTPAIDYWTTNTQLVDYWTTSTPVVLDYWNTFTPYINHWTTSSPVVLSMWTTSTPYITWTTSTPWVNNWTTLTSYTSSIVGDYARLYGSDLGGIYVENDVLIDITNVSTLTGAIIAFTYTGVAATLGYQISSSTVITRDSLGEVIENAPGLRRLGTLDHLTVTNVIISGNTVGTLDSNQTLYLDASGSGTVDVSGNRITSVATPADDYDATTKKYVDDSVYLVGTKGFSLSLDVTNFVDQFGTVDDGVEHYLNLMYPVSNPGEPEFDLPTGVRAKILCSTIAVITTATNVVVNAAVEYVDKTVDGNLTTATVASGLYGAIVAPIPATTATVQTLYSVQTWKTELIGTLTQWSKQL